MYTYIPSFLDFLPIQVTIERRVEFPVLYTRFSLLIYFIPNNVYMLIPTSKFIPAFSLLGIHTFVLYVYVSISALQISSLFIIIILNHIRILLTTTHRDLNMKPQDISIFLFLGTIPPTYELGNLPPQAKADITPALSVSAKCANF